MYRFLLTRRWLGYALLALVAAAVFVVLGLWQFGRARTVTAPVQAADPAAAARPLADVLAGRATVDGAVAGQLVQVAGRWDAAAQVTVPDRAVGGRNGSWVVTPLRPRAGPAVLVVRGFVADGAPVGPAPTGAVRVDGWLAGSEPVPDGRAPDGADRIPAVSVPVFVNRVSYPLLDGYVGLTRAVPAAAAGGLTPVPLPGGGRGSVVWSWQSLGYALQWNLFAVGAFVVLGIAARQHAGELRARRVQQVGVAQVSFAPEPTPGPRE